ncbi:MAG: hypothetical protein ACTSWN_02420 [Promethearchaeota archaeon]
MDEADYEYREKYIRLLFQIKKEFPNFDIIHKKDSRFSQMLGKITFWNRDFNRRYNTTIGPKIYVSHLYDDPQHYTWKSKFKLMCHERIHMRQMRKYGLIPFFLVFGLFPLPAKLAYFRRKWEAEAYELNIFFKYQDGGREAVLSEKYINDILDQFCGPFYFWTWHSRKAIVRWMIKTVKKIEKGLLIWQMLSNRRRFPSNCRRRRNYDVPILLKILYPEFRRQHMDLTREKGL